MRGPAQVAEEEGIRGFYRGFGAVLVGSIPGSVAYYGAFEAAKLVLPPGSGLAGGLATGAAAQLVAGAIFTPMDIIKERMQVASAKPRRLARCETGTWDRRLSHSYLLLNPKSPPRRR